MSGEKLAKPLEVIVAVLALLAAGALWLGYGVLGDIRQEQRDSTQRNALNRAVLCDIGKGIGVTLSEKCNDPLVVSYRDPLVVEGSSASARSSQELRRAVCALLTQVQVEGTAAERRKLAAAAADLCSG